MKMEASLRLAILCLIISLLLFSGCAVIQSLAPGSIAQPVNYALASNSAVVSASNYTPGHNPLTTINGITSSEGWDDGEGWECRFDRKRPRSGGWSRLDPKTTIEFGVAWLEVKFDGSKLINKVTIYTLDSEKYPLARHGIRDAWLQLWKEYGWTNVGEIENGAIVFKDSLRREPALAKMVFRFDLTKTEKIRLVVFRSSDFKTGGGKWSDDRKVEKSVARVVEIEATGLAGTSDDQIASSGKKRVEPAPEFVLQDMNGEWVRLSNFRGKVVIITFWAEWSSQSQRQMRELTKLYNEYRDQDVVVMGISVNEGGAERIRPFVEANNLKYTILIADTGVKSDYGGIGKLPSSFVIDQEGNIYNEYFEYRGKHIFKLDIGELLPSK